jgi:hypothetical protein
METSTGWERTKRVIDIVAGLSVIATMVFIALQWNEMRTGAADTHDLAVAAKSQADAAKSQADNTKTIAEAAKSQAENTKHLALAAADQVIKLAAGVRESHALAKAARDSMAQARDNFTKDQTPYVWATPKEPIVKIGENIRWDIQYSNYGRSPALNMRSCIQATWGNAGLSFLNSVHFPSMDECIGSLGSTINPKSVSVLPPGYPGYSSTFGSDPLTEPLFNAITSTEGGGFIYGVFQYEDKAGNLYESAFCNFRFRSGAVGACDRHNYIKEIKR